MRIGGSRIRQGVGSEISGCALRNLRCVMEADAMVHARHGAHSPFQPRSETKQELFWKSDEICEQLT
jgi:hypothetical protein